MLDLVKGTAFVAVAAYCLNHLGLVDVRSFGQQFVLSRPTPQAAPQTTEPTQIQTSELQITGISK
ncbi:MAG: hypothetical protein HC781_23135 [Leptolyngbyaceae cyanobacterium CSU_1_4]|nr:hypothetical protein [Leptolyngbyaceae cyanobacterium CSU_1_4]